MSSNHALALLATSIATAMTAFAQSLENGPNVIQLAPSEIVTGVGSAPIAMGQAPLNIPTNNVGVANTTLTPDLDSGLLSAAETVAAGKALTGLELDINGVPHLPAVNTKKPSITTKGMYKKGVGIGADVHAAAVAEAKLKQAAISTVINTVATIASGAAPMPGVTGAAPMPGVTGMAPLPGVTGMAPLPGQNPGANVPHVNEKLRESILQEIAKLTNEMCVDFQSISEILTEHKATDGTFATVPLDDFPALYKAVVGWNVSLQLIARSTAACLALNGNDQATIVEYIYTQGQFGCTDPALVSKHDTWRLYEMLMGYQNQLEAHFQKPTTAKNANPYL
ncbi:hypothetical protein S144_51 [Shewanella sp. phage 1/44]|uniref:hypothetical protein n=1 Tax=Shewanella sp. phage 1/44 TaxID=1458862 RepID=UPI0004F6B07B|nr:hypothetical protein S144_51 [Shewanella sp. phage 1/44]AHK11765.1 hypothetical protein S144_51 [Shewanella sp. phage 1/44]